jgi:hypothetical protein
MYTLPLTNRFPVIDSHITESVGDKAVITAEFIRVNETATFHLFDRHLKHSAGIDHISGLFLTFEDSPLLALHLSCIVAVL